MKRFGQFPSAAARGIRYVLSDVDDTLTYQSRLPAAAYSALERLREAGLKVIPVTAAPAGWCDLMARMWPVDGVIGENGGFYFRMLQNDVHRRFWLGSADRAQSMARLSEVADQILASLAGVEAADDQTYRLTTWAIRPQDRGKERRAVSNQVAAAWREAGANCTINSLWVLGWYGDFDKLAMAKLMMAEAFGTDIAVNREQVIYVGDSLNDQPMFRFFPHSVAVSSITDHLEDFDSPPAWVTMNPGGSGFVEVATRLLAAR